MHETKHPDEITELLRNSYTKALSGIIAIDGRDGVGKTHLAIALQRSIGGTLVSLDDFILKNRGGYVSYLKTDELKAAVNAATRPIFIEGVCVLSALNLVLYNHDLLIYVKRLVAGYYWIDEDICNPAEEPGLCDPKGDKPGVTEFRKELIRYHARYRPSRHADIIFLTRVKP